MRIHLDGELGSPARSLETAEVASTTCEKVCRVVGQTLEIHWLDTFLSTHKPSVIVPDTEGKFSSEQRMACEKREKMRGDAVSRAKQHSTRFKDGQESGAWPAIAGSPVQRGQHTRHTLVSVHLGTAGRDQAALYQSRRQ